MLWSFSYVMLILAKNINDRAKVNVKLANIFLVKVEYGTELEQMFIFVPLTTYLLIAFPSQECFPGPALFWYWSSVEKNLGGQAVQSFQRPSPIFGFKYGSVLLPYRPEWEHCILSRHFTNFISFIWVYGRKSHSSVNCVKSNVACKEIINTTCYKAWLSEVLGDRWTYFVWACHPGKNLRSEWFIRLLCFCHRG